MSGLRDTSSVLANLGQLHIVTGRITYDGSGVPSISSNDPTATVADTGVGNCTVTFGQAFLAAPQVLATPLKLTHSAITQHTVTCEQATTTTAEFRVLRAPGGGILTGSATFDPASLADGVGETSSGITVTGAALGDYVLVSAPYDLQDITVTGYVQAANTVEIRVQNESGGVIDLASGTWRVAVIPQASIAGASPDPATNDGFMFVAIGLRNI